MHDFIKFCDDSTLIDIIYYLRADLDSSPKYAKESDSKEKFPIIFNAPEFTK